MRRGSLLRLGLLALLWGSSFLFIKVAVEGVSPTQLVLARLALGALVLLGFVAARREPLPRDARLWGHLVAAALVANIVPYFLFGWAEQRGVASAVAGSLNATTPLFTLAIAWATGTERRMGPARAAGLLIGFLGAVVALAPWRTGAFTVAGIGQLACLLAAASYGIGYVYLRRFITGRGFSPLALAASQLTTATVLLALTAPVTARGPVNLTGPVTASILALGMLGTGIAYILNYRLIADEGATSASTVTYLLPVVALVLGIIILGEPIAWTLFAGTGLILLGIAVSEGRLRGLLGERRPVTPVGPPGDGPAGAGPPARTRFAARRRDRR
jgi:drug/metabolite transporter (DMT)-like permease